LLAGLPAIEASPKDDGVLELIARRPTPGEREVLDAGELSTDHGLVGDGWLGRGSRQSADGSAEVNRQLTLMNSRAIALFAGDRAHWPLAGDQLYVDLDLSEANLPAGTRLRIGGAVIEISAEPHTGCQKFRERFGDDASQFLRSPEGKPWRLRGINARVIESGPVLVGDRIVKVPAADLVR